VPPWCPTQSQAVDLQAEHSEPPRVHPNKQSHSRDDKLITDGNCGLPHPDPKRFCGNCNSLVASTSSKASARAWRSDIGTRELNNASEISSAVIKVPVMPIAN